MAVHPGRGRAPRPRRRRARLGANRSYAARVKSRSRVISAVSEGGLGTKSPTRYKSVSWMFARRSGYGRWGRRPDWDRGCHGMPHPAGPNRRRPGHPPTSSSHGAPVNARKDGRSCRSRPTPRRHDDATQRASQLAGSRASRRPGRCQPMSRCSLLRWRAVTDSDKADPVSYYPV